MKNKKGFTMVELIVSIALISIVLIFLLRLLLTIRDMDDKSLNMIEYEEKTSLIIKKIQSDIKDVSNCTMSKNSPTRVTLNCSANRVLNSSLEGKTFSQEGLTIPINNVILNINTSEKTLNYINCLEGALAYNGGNYSCPVETWSFLDENNNPINLGQIDLKKDEKVSGALYVATINVKDSKDNDYPIEISYYTNK